MPSREELKRLVAEAIDRRGEEIVRLAQEVQDNPEPGYREVKTSALVQEQFRQMGVPFRAGIALTGVKGLLSGGAPGPTVAVLGELDSMIVPDHARADPATGAAHACGHHAQIGMLIAVARGLLESGVLPHLSGRVALLAVPAEEYIEIEFRDGLRREGKVEFLVGKQEFIRLGEMDDIDIAMMTHTTSNPEHRRLAVGGTNNAMVAKRARFHGRAAHAGAAPWKGVNALNAAMLALSAIHANRETFRDEDTVRVHPIITKGGDAVSAVPADVRLETFVRARTLEAVLETCTKVDRCLRAGALAVGGSVTVVTLPGYLPIRNDPTLSEVYRANAVALVGEEGVAQAGHSTGSTDMGDVSHLIPAIHPYAGGAVGSGHGRDYLIQDWENAVLTAAKAMAWTVVDLLAEGAALAGRVKDSFTPALTKEDYLNLLRGIASEKTYAE